MIPKQKKTSASKYLQALTQGLSGMKQVTLPARIYVGRNTTRFVVIVPVRKKISATKKVYNILLSAQRIPEKMKLDTYILLMEMIFPQWMTLNFQDNT